MDQSELDSSHQFISTFAASMSRGTARKSFYCKSPCHSGSVGSFSPDCPNLNFHLVSHLGKGQKYYAKGISKSP